MNGCDGTGCEGSGCGDGSGCDGTGCEGTGCEGTGCEGTGWGVGPGSGVGTGCGEGSGCGDGTGCEGTGCDCCMEVCPETFKTTITLMTVRDSSIRIFLLFINHFIRLFVSGRHQRLPASGDLNQVAGRTADLPWGVTLVWIFFRRAPRARDTARRGRSVRGFGVIAAVLAFYPACVPARFD